MSLPFLRTLSLCALLLPWSCRAASEPPDRPSSRRERTIAGWTVAVDSRLLEGPDQPLGERTLDFLAADLSNIAAQVAPAPLAHLRTVRIVVDLSHGTLDNMQYHPSPGWLEGHGFSRELARCVHVPVAAQYASPEHRRIQPWCLCHELAHSFHDQVLGFDEPKIRALWEQYRRSGRGESVLHMKGRLERHYALTDHKEFFAEMTEAYLGMNDFYPFNRAELQQAEPEIYEELRRIWSPSTP